MDFDIQIRLELDSANLLDTIEALPSDLHLTLAILEIDKPESIYPILAEFAAEWDIEQIAIPAILRFPHAVCLAPIPSLRLIGLRAQLIGKLIKSGAKISDHYAEDTWLPHITICREEDSHNSAQTSNRLSGFCLSTARLIEIVLLSISTGEVYKSYNLIPR